MNCPTLSSPFASLDVQIAHLESEKGERDVDKLWQALDTELSELESNSGVFSDQLLHALCDRFDPVLHLSAASNDESALSQKMKMEGVPLLMRLIRILEPFSALRERRVDYLLFTVALERRLEAHEETLLTYYLHILFSSPNQRFDLKSAASFRQFYDHFIERQEPQLQQLLQHAIEKDREINQAALPSVGSLLDRLDQLEEWGVASRVLIAHYLTAKTALKRLSPQDGWEGVVALRNRINARIERLGQSERQEGLTALESQQAALTQYQTHFNHCIKEVDPQTPEEVRELQERLFALFSTFFHDHLLRGPFMLLHPPFPEVNGEPTCAICLLGSASRKELSLHSDFEAFFLIKRERGAWDHCLEQIDTRLHFLKTYRKELRHLLERHLHYAQEFGKSREMDPDALIDRFKEELKQQFQAAIEPEQKHFLKSLIGQLPQHHARRPLDALSALLNGAIDHLEKETNSADGAGSSPLNGENIMPVTPQLQKAWNLKQKLFHSHATAEEKEMSGSERRESRLLTFLGDVIRDSFCGCSLKAVSQQREAIAEAIETLAIVLGLPLGSPATTTIDQLRHHRLLREEESERIAFLFNQPMKGFDFAYIEEWLQRLKVSFFALGQSAVPEGLESLKFSDQIGIHLDIPDFDGRGIEGVYRSPDAFAALQTPVNCDQCYRIEELTSPGTRGVPPNYWLLKSLPLEGESAPESSLTARYSTALEKVLGRPAPDGGTLRQNRALKILAFRLHCFEEKGPFDPNGPVDIKADFIELLHHAIGDLGNFFGFAETNTLDIIDRLAATGKLSKQSEPLLKKAVADLYMMRIRKRGFSPKERKELETLYWLVLLPLYAIFRSALIGCPLEELFVNIDLLDVAFREAIAPEGSDWREQVTPESFEAVCIDEQLQLRRGGSLRRPSRASMEVVFQLARHLVDTGERSLDHHLRYYSQFFSRRLQPLRRRYIEGAAAADCLKQQLAHHPTIYGYREVETFEREALSQKLMEITTAHREEWNGISVEVKGSAFSQATRYLSRALVEGILTNEGMIKQGYGAESTRGRVCRYQSEQCDLHFKQEPENFETQSPFHPGREQAASRLVMRLCGHGISFSELLSFVVYSKGKKAKEYFVLVSQTVKGEPLDPSKPRNLDPKRLTGALLTLPILVPGDGRAVNYIVTETTDEYGNVIEELVSVDNDVSLGQPAAKKGLFNRIVPALYSVLFPLFARFPLEKRAVEEFLQLHPQLLLLDWFSELVEWNGKSSEAFASVNHSRISPLVLFDRGTGARLLLQMQELQQMLKKGGELNALELLKSVICYHEEQVTHVGQTLHSLYSKAHTVEGLKQSLGRDLSQSISMSQSSMVNYQQLPDIDADLSAHLPQNGVEEVVALSSIGPERSLEKGVKSCFNVEPAISEATQHLILKNFVQQAQRELRLAYCDVLDDAMLLQLIKKSGAKLEILDLRHCPLITEAFIIPLAKQCPNLKELYISHCPKITEFPEWEVHRIRSKRPVLFRSLEHLEAAHCVNLRKLTPVAPRLTFLKANDNPCLNTLALSNGTPSNQQPAAALRYLNLSGSSLVAEADISRLLVSANQLTYLLLKELTQLLDTTFTQGIRRLKKVQQLDIEGCQQISNGAICQTLPELVKLEELRVSRCSQIEEEGFCKAVKGLLHLRKLYLFDCFHLSGERLAHMIAHSQSLKSVHLTHLDLLTCADWDVAILVKVIEKLQQLKFLNLSSSIHLGSNRLLKVIERLDTLKTLDLAGCGEVQESHIIRLLLKLRQLKRFKLNGSVIDSKETCTAIANHPTLAQLTLRKLNLSNHCQLKEEEVIRLLRKIGHVQVIDMRGIGWTIGEEFILQLSRMNNCDVIYIDQVDISNSTKSELIELIPFLRKTKGVKHLNLSKNDQLEEAHLIDLATQMVELESLNLSGCNQLQGDALAKALERLTHLTTLKLSRCWGLEGDALAKALERLTSLTTLNLSWCKQLQGDALAKALERLTSLTTLNLSGCKQLQGDALAKALERLTSLTTLDLSGCWELQEEALNEAIGKIQLRSYTPP